MLSFNGINLKNIFKKEFYIIIILIKVTFAGEFIDLKKLYSCDSYFVVLDTGLYLYDFNNFECSFIHQFNQIEYRIDSNNNIILVELFYTYKAYIFCLVNEFLFIYNEYTYKLLNYSIKEIINFKDDDYYNIMPYKIENNNIYFIIAYNNDTTNLFFYFYHFNLNIGLIEPKIILFIDMNIQNKMIRCQINSYLTFIICFYHSKDNDENYLTKTIFDIEEMNLKRIEISNYIRVDGINQIKLAKSYNDKFFFCFSNLQKVPSCFINNFNNSSNEFKEINCKYGTSWSPNYKVFYFGEINAFLFISKYYLT